MNETHVVTCFVESDGKVLILKRSGSVSSYQQKWAGISGYIETGKTAVQQAWQELGEEAGLNSENAVLIKKGEVLVVNDEVMEKRWIVHPFRFNIADKNEITLDWEQSDHTWIAPEQILHYNTVPGLYEAWEKVK
ncbi:MAG: NUDIX domain-containing protein [Clostridiaceae bacterium]